MTLSKNCVQLPLTVCLDVPKQTGLNRKRARECVDALCLKKGDLANLKEGFSYFSPVPLD